MLTLFALVAAAPCGTSTRPVVPRMPSEAVGVVIDMLPVLATAAAAGAVGVCGAGACAGWVCASRIRPDVSSARAALPNVTQAKRQAKSESANDSLYDVTMDFRAEGTGGERERETISASPG